MTYNPETGEMRWRVTRPRAKAGAPLGWRSPKGYVIVGVDNRLYKAHRLAWLYVYGKWPEDQIDHINGVKDDNRIANLRDVCNRVNVQNIKKPRADNTSGFTGVTRMHKLRARPWVARVNVNGSRVLLGYYRTPVEAHEAYLSARRANYEGNTL